MRATHAIAGVAVLLLALCACGQAADQGAPANQPAPSTPTPVSPTTPPGSPAPAPTSAPAPPITGVPPVPGAPPGAVPQDASLLPKEQVDFSAVPSYYTERTVWSLNGGRSLLLYAMARDACSGVAGRVVEQSENTVRIMVSSMDTPQGGPPDGGGMCAQVLTPRPVTVHLNAPVGKRKVVVTEGP